MRRVLLSMLLVLLPGMAWAQATITYTPPTVYPWMTADSTAVTSTVPIVTSGTLGAELVTNGDFASGDLTGWAGAAWAYDAGTARHTPGTATDMTQAGLAAVVGTTYKTSITITAASGGARINFGGVFTAYRGTGTYTDYITAKTTDALAIYPDDAAFDGTVDNISVKALTLGTSSFDGSVEFHGPVTAYAGIDIADGREIAIGRNALAVSTRGTYNLTGYNIGIGSAAGTSTTTGHVTAVGYHAGYSNTTGVLTAVGKDAGRDNTEGHASFFGWGAGKKNTTSESVCVGDEACGNNLTGQAVAVGYYALAATTSNATGIGYYAGAAQADAPITAVGYYAAKATTGYNVTAVGTSALENNVAGDQNTVMGHQALWDNTSGDNNTAVGYRAGGATGANANTTGGNNTYIGALTGANSATQRTNTTMLGYGALSTADNQVSLGDSSVNGLVLGARAQSAWGTKVVVDATATAFVRVSVADDDYEGCAFTWMAYAEDADTDARQTRTGTNTVAILNNSGTEAAVFSTGDSAVAVTAGTFTCTFDGNSASANTIDLRANCDTSLDAAAETLTFEWRLDCPSSLTVTPQ